MDSQNLYFHGWQVTTKSMKLLSSQNLMLLQNVASKYVVEYITIMVLNMFRLYLMINSTLFQTVLSVPK